MTMKGRLVRGLQLAILTPVLWSIGGIALSHEATGEVRGKVRDARGAIVSIALVSIQNEETDWSIQEAVNAKGEFVFRRVAPGVYRFEVLSPRFKRYYRTGIPVKPNNLTKVAPRLVQGSPEEVVTSMGGGHVILGYGWNDVGYANWSHSYAAMITPLGRIIGRVKMSLLELETPDTPELSLEYTNDIECVEIDETTGSAWLGGRLSETNNPDFLPLGIYVVDFARDGGPGNAGDAHGDTVPAWFGEPETCHARPGPLYMDPVERGNIIVR
jgi:hypothetical protein